MTVSGGGITRTVAVTQAGQSTGGGATCPNPVTFSGNTGNFNTTGAVCYRTNANINGWGCYNFEGRTLTVGGVARTCGQIAAHARGGRLLLLRSDRGTVPVGGYVRLVIEAHLRAPRNQGRLSGVTSPL